MDAWISKECLRDFEDLMKKPKLGYSNCRQDIIGELKRHSDTRSIVESEGILRQIDEIFIVKISVKNSNSNIGKSSGYRVLALINTNMNNVILLTVYPKVGAKGKLNVSEQEVEACLLPV